MINRSGILETNLPSHVETLKEASDRCKENVKMCTLTPFTQPKIWWLFPFADTLDPCQPEAAGEKVKGVRRDLNRKAEHVLCTMGQNEVEIRPLPLHTAGLKGGQPTPPPFPPAAGLRWG
jgi:hypothetical protein